MIVDLGGRKIGGNEPVFVIAEISANHSQKLENAVQLMKKAKEAGVDAVKVQAYTPDTITIDSDKECFRVKHFKWGGKTLYEIYEKAYMPWEWLPELKKTADKLGIVFFATVFDNTSADRLEAIDVPVYKIASFELVDIPLIKYVASKRKPVILSTGMATENEIEEAVSAARSSGAEDVILLKCVSEYPARPEHMNLRSIPDMARRFSSIAGLSDHTLGINVALASVALGAKVIEKHLTLSRRKKTPDSFFSLEPSEMKLLVESIRMVEDSLGKVYYGCSPAEKDSWVLRRSLFVVDDVKKGEPLTQANVRSIRPAKGIAPKYLYDIINKKAVRNIKKGTPLSWELFK